MRAPMYFLSVLTAAVIFAVPGVARADKWDHGRGLHVHHPRWGSHITVLPRHHLSVWVGRAKYYYHDGIYYTGAGVNYVVVPPPIGAVVTAVPADYQPVLVNGVTYYVNDGVYYVNNGYGYQVVPEPARYPVSAAEAAAVPAAVSAPVENAAPQAAPESSQPAAGVGTAESPNEFTVNIPNGQGGYTPVVIKKTDKGYTGPQGEFYDTFPKVEQLKAMYGK